jgi:hypothetical protein
VIVHALQVPLNLAQLLPRFVVETVHIDNAGQQVRHIGAWPV